MPKGLSVVIPTYNEKENIKELVSQIRSAFLNGKINYEIIFVDDSSTDGTVEEINKHKGQLPVRVYTKYIKHGFGKRGKASSLLIGFDLAKYDSVCMIDADLQYPPKAIVPMYKKLKKADIVVANRKFYQESRIRIFLSKGFRIVFGRFLLRLDFDVQSGLKVFKKEILSKIRINSSKWGFDFEFLFKSKKLGYIIMDHSIEFSRRFSGKSKINPVFSSMEIGRAVLLLRLTSLALNLKFLDWPHISEKRGIDWKNKKDFLFVPEIYSAKKQLFVENIHLFLFILCLHIAMFLTVSLFVKTTFIIYTFVCVNIFYLLIMIFRFYVVYRSVRCSVVIDFSREEINSIRDSELPLYSVMIPLYQEAEVVSQIKKAMTAIDYPSNKLDFIITVEKYDKETKTAIKNSKFPKNFRTLVLPDVSPKTKPKALNAVFKHIKGEYFTIYDAEVVPDRDQLKKAYLLFKKHSDVSCIQTLLDHYNHNQNIITKWFNAEFSFYYDMFLPGLQSLGYPISLSGHSTHFRTKVIREIGAWDPYNVTEDCDLGMRLRRFGYKIAIMRSYSKEEATSAFGNWLRQRSRWMKGFLQTTIVHLRHPLRFKNEVGGGRNFFAFLFLVPGTVAVNVLNLVFWILFVLWLVFRPGAIKELFPGIVLHISVLCFLFGNFVFIYLNLIGLYQRKRFSLVKYSLLTSIYWVMLSVASVEAVVQLITNPYYWEKTRHGDHLV